MVPAGNTDQNGTSVYSFDSGTAGEAATVEVVGFGKDGTFEAEETFVLPDLPVERLQKIPTIWAIITTPIIMPAQFHEFIDGGGFVVASSIVNDYAKNNLVGSGRRDVRASRIQ